MTVLLAASVQRSIGMVIAYGTILGFIIYLVVNMRRARPEQGAESELAPNRKPYYADEGLEGPRLDRFLTMALVLLGVLAVGLPFYWLSEPGRQEDSIVRFDAIFASRGEELFNTNCASCHGAGAVGGVAAFVLQDRNDEFLANVAWKAPALNTALLRFEEDEVQYVLDHGRAFSPMQPWSTEGGGAMNTQQIQNLVDYLGSIVLSNEDAQDEIRSGLVARVTEVLQIGVVDDDERAAIAERVEQTFEEATSDAEALQDLGVVSGDEEAELRLGSLMFNNEAAVGTYSCARCHTPGWSYERPGLTGEGAFGPKLWGVIDKYNDTEDLASFLGEGCAIGEVYGRQSQCKSGQMPAFSAMYTPEQVAAVAAYVTTLDGGQQYAFDPATEQEAQG